MEYFVYIANHTRYNPCRNLTAWQISQSKFSALVMCSGSSYEILTYVLRQVVTDKQIQFPADLIRLRILWLLRSTSTWVIRSRNIHFAYTGFIKIRVYMLSLSISLSHMYVKIPSKPMWIRVMTQLLELRTILQRESQNS